MEQYREDYSERLEAYLRNELAVEQMERLEQQLARDPLLKQEYEFQQDIIGALCAYRRRELKQRLNTLHL